MGKKHLRKRGILALFAVILIALILWTIWGNSALELNELTLVSSTLPEAFHGYRIAHVSDLHNAQMGSGNETLLAMLRSAQPDLIAITGDLIDSRNTEVEVALDFAREAVKIAPCYYVTGNHEARVDAAFESLQEGLMGLGVTVLRNEGLLLEKDGHSICLIGLDDPSFSPGEDSLVTDEYLTELVDETASFTLLLSHRPELFDIYAEHHVDLVLSGHAHGGQFRLPFLGGIVAPNQGLFPPYDGGLYTQGDTNMVVSRGIGNSLFPFRFNNRPEVILIELNCE